jgi:hypothetical protein
MLKLHLPVCAALFCLLLTGAAFAANAPRVVIYDNQPTEVAPPPAALPAESGDLWVTLADLKRATGFVNKPQGVCRAELCFPLPKGRKAAFLSKQRAVTWFNLSEFARLLRQPTAHDAEAAVWYFGPRPEEQNGFVASLKAPDFTLPDAQGRLRKLSAFRGKKVLLITWASW